MKNIITLMLCLFLFATNFFEVKAEGDYYAKSYVLIDGYSGEVLEGKDYHTIRSVASISKIMTAILAIESEMDLFYSYVISSDCTNIEGSSLYLKEGEKYRLVDLIYGLLLRSGNDASYAISKIVSKDTPSFVKKMNEKAFELGMYDTFFSNPCGLDVYDLGNMSTSYDMAMLMKYCMNNELFREIISTKKYQFGNKVYENKNKLLKNYQYLLGGKTGYTYKAKRTLVTASLKDDQYLIAVTLDCGSDYGFHKYLYEKYFDLFAYIIFLKKGINHIDEFLINSNNYIGLRVRKELLNNAIKEYFIYPITKDLSLYLVLENGEKIICPINEQTVKFIQKR